MAPERKQPIIDATEHDGSSPETKRVLLYGWTGSEKVRLKVDSNGVLDTSATLNAAASQVVVQASQSSLKVEAYQGTSPWVVSFDASSPFTVVQASASSLNMTEANSAAIKTAVETIDNAIAGTEMQVDVVAALPAGDNNIGNVDIASIAAGDNNIGNVDIASIAAGDNNIGNVDIVTQPARVFTTDSISTSPDVARLTASLVAVQPKYAVINVAASGDNTIVAGVTNKRIRVLEYALVVGTGGDQVTFKNGLAGTAVTGPMRFAANGGISASYSPVGLFESASSASLALNSSLGSQISGHLVYVEV